MNARAKIEAILFWKGEPVTVASLVEMSGETKEVVLETLDTLEQGFNGGISIVRLDDMVELRTSSGAASLIEELSQAELKKDIGKAGLETLAVVLYQGPVSRAEIDHVRGVNSNFILRNLSMRGLIEKVPNPNDKRSFLYQPTLELLAHLGVGKLEDLPQFESVRTELESFKNQEEVETV